LLVMTVCSSKLCNCTLSINTSFVCTRQFPHPQDVLWTLDVDARPSLIRNRTHWCTHFRLRCAFTAQHDSENIIDYKTWIVTWFLNDSYEGIII
jgi:hypothetical protein